MASDFNLIEAQRTILYMDSLSSSAKLVAFAVFSFWSTKSPRPYPGTAMLQRVTKLSKPTVMRAIKELVAAQVVHVATDQNVHGQRFVFDLEPVMKLDRSKNNTGQVEGHKPVKNRSKTGKGHFTNEHQNGSISTEGIQEEIHKKEPICAPLSRKRKTAPEKVPVVGAHELKLHYLSEFQKHRTAEAKFTPAQWSRAMKALGELVTAHGLEESKRIVSTALQQLPTPTFTPKVNPWDIVANANNHKATMVATGRSRHARGPAQQTGVDVFAGIEAVAE